MWVSSALHVPRGTKVKMPREREQTGAQNCACLLPEQPKASTRLPSQTSALTALGPHGLAVGNEA